MTSRPICEPGVEPVVRRVGETLLLLLLSVRSHHAAMLHNVSVLYDIAGAMLLLYIIAILIIIIVIVTNIDIDNQY